jgi:hypothetical protein
MTAIIRINKPVDTRTGTNLTPHGLKFKTNPIIGTIAMLAPKLKAIRSAAPISPSFGKRADIKV